MNATEFAAELDPLLRESAATLREAVEADLASGASDWPSTLAAMDTLYAQVYEGIRDEEPRGFGQAITILDSLERTVPRENRQAQADLIATWLTTAVYGAATDAAADGMPGMGVEWVTMADERVRLSHADAHGQVRRAGQAFDIGGFNLQYPGQPLGPPEVWINCRCVLRVVEIADALVAAADAPKAAIIAAVPADGDDVWKVSGDGDPHVTLAFFGDAEGLDVEPIAKVLGPLAAAMDPITDAVMGRGVLGEDSADVALIDARGLAPLREALVADPAVTAAMARAEQFPVWVPHLTLGYPDTPAKGEPPQQITFDSLELWVGDDRHRYTLGSEENFPREAGMSVTETEVTNGPPEDLSDAPEIGEEDLALPVPWYGVLAPEGVWSGDRRRFTEGSLRHRDLPLPLKYQPASDDGHRGSVVVGRIDRVWREGGELRAEGVFDSSPYAYESVRQIAERMIRGVSVDVDDAEGEMADGSDDVPEGSLTFTSARVSAATLVPIPAFAEAFVALGFWSDHEPPTEGAETTVTFEGINPEVFEMVTGWPKEWLFVSEEPWDGSASRFTPEQWKRSCILHVCDGDEKSCHKLPIREPGGALSRRGVHAAASRLNQVDAPPDKVAAAKRSLASAYRQLGEEPPFADVAQTFAAAPGLHKDGTPPVCKYGDEEATKYVLFAEGMAYIPTCEKHLDQAKADAAKATPDGTSDPDNINRVGDYTATEFDIPPARTKDAPGWITHPRPTRRITAYWVDGVGAAKIGWGLPGDFNRCRTQLVKYVQNPDWLAGLCANLHYRALRTWPGQHRGAHAITASVGGPPPRAWFANPNLPGKTPMHVGEDGRVYGHLALWDSCHTSRGCEVPPPRSSTNYAYFLHGAVLTDDGIVPVGQITLGTGHASLSLGLTAAIEHYDNTGTAVADVTVGEDAHGIWVAGALRSTVTADQVHALRAAALSGDWRPAPEGVEMVAALAVNVPGYLVPRVSVAMSGDKVYALTAAGVATPESVAMLDMVTQARRNLRVERARRALRAGKR